MSSILTVNARGGMGLTSARTYFRMTPAQFRSYIGSHYVTLRTELASHGISYDALGPALVPSTSRHEVALLFNIDLVGLKPRLVTPSRSTIIPVLERNDFECSCWRHRAAPHCHTRDGIGLGSSWQRCVRLGAAVHLLPLPQQSQLCSAGDPPHILLRESRLPWLRASDVLTELPERSLANAADCVRSNMGGRPCRSWRRRPAMSDLNRNCSFQESDYEVVSATASLSRPSSAKIQLKWLRSIRRTFCLFECHLQ